MLTQTAADQDTEGKEEKLITEERLVEVKRRYNPQDLTCYIFYMLSYNSLAAVDNKMAELMEELKYESEDYLLIT